MKQEITVRSTVIVMDVKDGWTNKTWHICPNSLRSYPK